MTTPQADVTQLIGLEELAARNIAQAINAHPAAIPQIQRAIRDEIQSMSSHFTLAFADVQNQYESDVRRIESEFSFVRENWRRVAAAGTALLVIGALIGHFA